MRRICFITALLCAITVSSARAAGVSDAEQALTRALTAFRRAHHLSDLSLAPDLVAEARRHAAAMASAHYVFADAGAGARIHHWSQLEGIVGSALTWRDVQRAWTHSATSSSTMRSRGADDVGIGVVKGTDGSLYAAALFRARGGGSGRNVGARAERVEGALAVASARRIAGARVVAMLQRMIAMG